jgi:uncharacterized protein (TIGR02099 family)
MLKKSMLWLYRSILWITGVILAIALIAALTIQFWVMPNISQYKNSIASYATTAAGQKVTIGDIKASWRGLNPHLSISNIDIFDAENRLALQLKDTEVLVSWLSLPMLEPHLAELSIHSPELIVRRLASGEIFIAGVSMDGAAKPELPNWLLRQNTVAISQARIVWLDEKRNAAAVSLEHFNLQLHSPIWRSLVKNHLFTLSAIPSIGTKDPILVDGSFNGSDISKMETWSGNVNLQLKNIDLAALELDWSDYLFDIRKGISSSNVKIKFKNNDIQSIITNFNILDVEIQAKSDAAPITFRSFSGNLGWETLTKLDLIGSSATTKSGYTVSVDNLSAISDSGLNFKDLKADYKYTDAGEQSLNLKLANFNLANLQQYQSILPISETMQQRITTSAPSGAFENLDLHWEAVNNKTTAYRVNSKFNNLSINAQEQIPGFNNLSGELKASQKNGQLLLDSVNSKLDLKGILRWPVPINSLNGKVSWDINGKVTEINVDGLEISNPHLSGTLNASYKMDGIKGGYLDLSGKFDKADAKYALNYYPIMLGEATLHWLDTSILAGRIEDINLSVKGRLADFPFVDSQNRPDPKLGVFKASAKLSDALLDYGTGWPVINNLGLTLLFEGKRMELNAHTGKILGNQIIKSKTTIAQLDADDPILNITSEAIGPVSEGINFVNKSPVLEVTQGFTEGLKTSGNGKLSLGLTIPLQHLEAAKYKGLYQITNGGMVSADIPALSQINGLLEFTESSLSAKNIKAYAFGSPLVFNLNSGKDKVIRIAAKGQLNEDGLKQLFKEQNVEKVSDYISGSTDWTGNIVIQKPLVNVSIRSDLLGITSKFPAPLNKAAEQQLNLLVDKKQDENFDNIRVTLGNKIAAMVISSTDNGKLKLQRADISFNPDTSAGSADSDTVKDSKLTGISVNGKLDYLDADAWRYVIKNIGGGNKQETPFTFRKTALTINALDIFNRRINNLKISNISNKEGLHVNVQSREVTGDLQWISQNNGKLIARLSNLTIPGSAPDKLSAIKDSGSSTPQQFIKLEQDYPALDIVSDNFEFNKKNFGALELVAYPQNDNWDIQKIKFSSPDSVISAEGQWNNWIRSPNTFLNVSWDIKDLGNTLKRFGYPNTIKDGTGELKGRLHWPGSPSQFDTTRLNGDLEFEVRQGQILQAQPGVGRLLGLLSLQSLPRRLTLDFRDLFSNGFAFDKINATVKISQGVMRSDNFVMSGPAADVEIKGETNLQKETQHLFVKVMPRISDSLSLAALAGGPLAGAVAFLAQKVLKDPLNKIISTEYEITGTWDNPQEVKPTEDSHKKQNSNLISPTK